MCLLLLAIGVHKKYRLILAANRDEFYERPTEPAHFWDQNRSVLAGKDLRGGGTWLGITTSGRLAAITNFREAEAQTHGALSRGQIIRQFLFSDLDVPGYLDRIKAKAASYNGFNLILGTAKQLCFYSNRCSQTQKLSNGIYGLSNGTLDESWPKVEIGKAGLAQVIADHRSFRPDHVFKMLENDHIAPDSDLPDTGIDQEWERILSAIFIKADGYGTRSSTVVLIDRTNNVHFEERSFIPDKRSIFQFKIAD